MLGDGSGSSIDGSLTDGNNVSLPISFYFDGQAIRFILDTDQGQVFGTGVMENGLSTCSGNAGGTQSGPILGDLGDWRGQWIYKAGTPIPQAQTTTDSFFAYLPYICLYLPIAVVVLLLVIWFAPLVVPFKKTLSPNSKTSSSTLHRTVKHGLPEPGEERRALAEYVAIYTAADKLFDLSFEIEKSALYLGECGILVAKTLDAQSNQATALELWLFDAHSSQTVSKFLLSDFCYHDVATRSDLEQKGQTTIIQPEEIIIIEAGELRAKARIAHVEYKLDSVNPKSVFKKVVVHIAVWSSNH